MRTPKITENRIKQFLKQGKRFDGRSSEDFRELVVETGISKKAEGSARVKMGNTEVIVGIKMDVSTPYPDSPDKGNLMVTAELLPLSSPRLSLGRPGIDSIELARVTDRYIRESKVIDFSKLCIKEGEKVWTVFVDVYSINDDGNLFDAAAIGAIVALKNAKMPKYDEKEEKVLFGDFTDKGLPLSEDLPLSLTLYKIGDKFVVDPTREEEDVIGTRITVGGSNKSIVSMQKGEKGSITAEEFGDALDLYEKAWDKVFKKIEKHLK